MKNTDLTFNPDFAKKLTESFRTIESFNNSTIGLRKTIEDNLAVQNLLVPYNLPINEIFERNFNKPVFSEIAGKPAFNAIESLQKNFPSNQQAFNQIGLSIKDIYSTLFNNIDPVFKATKFPNQWSALIRDNDSVKRIGTIPEIWKTNFDFHLSDLTKSDFRISVVAQEIYGELDSNSFEEYSDKFNKDFNQFIPDTRLENNQKNNQTNEINELKLMIIELSEKFSNFEENTSNENLDADQSDEKNKKSVWKTILGLIGAFFFVCEFVEHSETAYQLILWLQQFIHLLSEQNILS